MDYGITLMELQTGLGVATIPDAITSSGGGNNSFYYTTPAVMDGLAINASWNPAASAGVNSMTRSR